MGAIQVKNVDERLHKALRARAEAEGMSLGDYVLDVLRRDLRFPSRREWLERVASRERIEADIVATIEAERGERGEALNVARRR